MRKPMDKANRQILSVLKAQGRISWVQLAEAVNLSPSAVQRRVETMQESGIIRNFTVAIDHEALGKNIHAFIQIKVTRQDVTTAQSFRNKICSYPEVQGFFKLSGNVDFLIDVSLNDIKALSDFIDNKILALDGVTDASSAIVLEDLPCSFEII
jgi:Lrp/AsnC family leucine-responsive transcriptional regulator